MLMRDPADPGHNLDQALRRARLGWWHRALIDSLVAAIIALAVAVAALWVAAYLSMQPGRLFNAASSVRTMMAAAAGGFSVSLLIAGLRAPSLLELARRIDRRLGQAERFSTSYEVLVAGGPRNVIAHQLVAEVEERAKDLEVGPVGRARRFRRFSRLLFAVPVVACVLLALPVPLRLLVASSPTAESKVAAERDSAAVAATLDGVAELLDLVAQQEDNDYLRALAASFSDLASRMGADALSAAESDRELQELTEHLRAASLEVGGAFAQAVDEALASQLNGNRPSAASRPASEDQAATGDDTEHAPALDANTGAPGLDAAYYNSLSVLMEQFQSDPGAIGLRPERPARTDSSAADSFYGGVLNAQMDPNAAVPLQPAGAKSEGEAGGTPVGAAERSDDSAGDAAGQGGADFGQASDAFLDLMGQEGIAAALPTNERDDGSFVEMELVPSAQDASTAVSSALLGSIAAFARADEAAFTSRGIGAEYADVVSRYFTPGSTSSSGKP